MKINELISFLQNIENKELPIYIFNDGDILLIEEDMFDLSINDRIDINIISE